MVSEKMTAEVMEYMVWIVEITAQEYFNGDKAAAYQALHNCGIWNLYVKHYEVTHTLGAEVIRDEIGARLAAKDKVITI